MQSFDTQVLPHDLESERSILGAILLHQPALATAQEVLSDQSFFDPAHRVIWNAIQALQKEETGIDQSTVISALRASGHLDAAGGPVYVCSLTDGMPRYSHIAHYSKLINEAYQKRAVISSCSNAIASIQSGNGTAHEIMGDLQMDLLRIAEQAKRTKWMRVDDILPGVIEEINLICERRTDVVGISSGYPDLNRLTKGWQPGQLIIVAGRPGHGKTSIALNFISEALQRDAKVGLFTLEMSAREVIKRMLLSDAEVSMSVDRPDIARVMESAGRLADRNLWVDEAGTLTITELRSKAQQLAAGHGLDLLVIDYLQLMSGASRRDHNRVAEISEISRGLKALAKDLGIPIIAMSQLNREVEKDVKRRPRLSDLRESGSIEQDADVVLFIWREELRKQETENIGTAELIVGKQRSGPVGETVYLRFMKEVCKFVSSAKPEQEAAAESWYSK